MPTPLAQTLAFSTNRAGGEATHPKKRLPTPAAAFRVLWIWMARSSQRAVLRELAQEGRLLSDVGLDREQVLREVAKPFWRR